MPNIPQAFNEEQPGTTPVAASGEKAGPARTGDQMLIDRHLPAFDETQIRHAVVDAPAELTWRAVKAVNLMEVGDVWPLARALSWLRDLPEKVGLVRNREAAPDRLSFDDLGSVPGWIKLDEVRGRELVLGAVGKVWKPRIDWLEVEPADFADFAEPDYAKLALAISVRPYGAQRSLITYEARTATTSLVARKRFRRYWRLIGWGAGIMMSGALRLIERDAEAAAAGAGVAGPAAGARGTPIG